MLNVKFQLLNKKDTWLKLFVIAFGIAIIIAAWPTAKCAVAGCSNRDRWCAADCSMECYSTRRVKRMVSPGYVLFDASGQPYCTQPTYHWGNVSCYADSAPGIRCGGVISAPDQQLPPSPSRFETCSTVWDTNTFTCCRLASPNPDPDPTSTPPTCTPEYDAPSIMLSSVTPPYPLTLGQDPDQEGFDVVISVTGGEKTNSCAEGPDNAPLESISLESVNLSAASMAWIEEELVLYYPGAQVKGSYPLDIAGTVQIDAATGTLEFHVDPLDPGTYLIEVEAEQDSNSNDTTSETFGVTVYLLEATITKPGDE